MVLKLKKKKKLLLKKSVPDAPFEEPTPETPDLPDASAITEDQQLAEDEKLHLPVVADASGKSALPPMECSTCHIGAECPEYKEGFVCYYEKEFNSFGTREADEIYETMYKVVGRNVRRLNMALLSEQVAAGGAQDPNVTRLSEVVMGQLRSLADFKRSQQSITVTATGPKAGGILSQLFGGRQEETIPLELNPSGQSIVQGSIIEEPKEESKVVVELTRTNQ